MAIILCFNTSCSHEKASDVLTPASDNDTITTIDGKTGFKDNLNNTGADAKVQNTDDKLVLYNLSLIDGTGASIMKNKMIFINEEKIEKIVDQNVAEIPDEYTKIDLKGYTVLPGFINAHVHSYFSKQALQTWLQNGVTTVREMAVMDANDAANRKSEINKDPFSARIVTSTRMLTAVGGYHPAIADYVSTPEEAEEKTNGYINAGADFIKISIEDDLQGQTFNLLSLEEIQSITRAAHNGNKRVAAHISHERNLRLAIDGGVDDLNHMVVEPMDDKMVNEIVEKGIAWVPTLELWLGVSQTYQLTWDKTAIENLALFYKAGGKIALGTDYGGYSVPFDDGMPMTEMKAMKAAGMSNMDIIISATKNGAYVCGMDDELGTLEPGKIADIIVARENPLENLDALSDLYMVIHNGTVVKEND